MTVQQWVAVATKDDIQPGEGFRVEIDEVPVAIWNVDDEYYATDDTCSHEESSLVEGDLWGEVIECALHGAQFDVRTGAVLSLPAVFPIKSYPVRVDGETVYVGWNEGA